jgi:hypothetical protein
MNKHRKIFASPFTAARFAVKTFFGNQIQTIVINCNRITHPFKHLLFAILYNTA